jgi:hypothetical protein
MLYIYSLSTTHSSISCITAASLRLQVAARVATDALVTPHAHRRRLHTARGNASALCTRGVPGVRGVAMVHVAQRGRGMLTSTRQPVAAQEAVRGQALRAHGEDGGVGEIGMSVTLAPQRLVTG